MAKKFSKLTVGLSPERQARIERMVVKFRQEIEPAERKTTPQKRKTWHKEK